MHFPKQSFPWLVSSSLLLLTLLPLKQATAQTFSEAQVTAYAEAVMEIENHRQQALTQIRQIMGQEPPEILCNQPSTYQDLPSEAHKIVTAYCENAEDVVSNTSITVGEFNQITRQIKTDPDLKERVQAVMRNLAID